MSQERKELESFLDTIKAQENQVFIARLTRYKIDELNGHLVSIEFFENTLSGRKIASFEVDKDPVIDCAPMIYDYNGDGFLDYSFKSAMAARGANEVRTLFIYDPKDKTFFKVRNSQQYPNIIYNEKLKCMDSWAFHGGTTQSFLRLEKDSLISTYTIDVHGNERVLGKYINGEWQILKTDTFQNDGFPRYNNFDPFEEYNY